MTGVILAALEALAALLPEPLRSVARALASLASSLRLDAPEDASAFLRVVRVELQRLAEIAATNPTDDVLDLATRQAEAAITRRAAEAGWLPGVDLGGAA